MRRSARARGLLSGDKKSRVMFEIFVMWTCEEGSGRRFLSTCSAGIALRLRNNFYKWTAQIFFCSCKLFVCISISRFKRIRKTICFPPIGMPLKPNRLSKPFGPANENKAYATLSARCGKDVRSSRAFCIMLIIHTSKWYMYKLLNETEGRWRPKGTKFVPS